MATPADCSIEAASDVPDRCMPVRISGASADVFAGADRGSFAAVRLEGLRGPLGVARASGGTPRERGLDVVTALIPTHGTGFVKLWLAHPSLSLPLRRLWDGASLRNTGP